MLRDLEMSLDISEVVSGMEKLNGVVMPAKIKAGLAAAGKQLMEDSVTGLPAMPIHRPEYSNVERRKAGELRASGAVFVDGKKTVGSGGVDTGHATGRYQPTVYGGTPIPAMSHEACVVFNAPYASIQHEKFPVKTEPTAGRYFMSMKLFGNSVKYFTIVSEAIRL